MRTPIIAMTADARASTRDACYAAGMDDYVSKPFTPADLAAALNRLVSRTFIRAGATQNTETEPIGAANRVYALLGKGSDVLARLKRRNRTVFRTVKYALIAALAYWIFIA